jgi:hypothetical protein
MMAEILRPDCFRPRRLSKDEITCQMLEESLRIIEYRFEKARAAEDQTAIEIIFDMFCNHNQVN